MTNQFPNGELRPTGKQTDHEDLSTSGLPATPLLLRCMSPFMCRFSDAGMTRLSTRCGGRRPKSAKARNRGKWGTGGAAGVYGDLAAVR